MDITIKIGVKREISWFINSEPVFGNIKEICYNQMFQHFGISYQLRVAHLNTMCL